MSLIEIILALALFSIIVTSLVRVQWGITDLAHHNARIVAAYHWANQALLQVLADGAASGLVDYPYTKCQNVMTALSQWRTGWNSTSTSLLGLLVPDLGEAEALGYDCAGQPKRFTDDFRVKDTYNLGFPVTSVDISRGTIFASLKSAVDIDPDIAVIEPEYSPEFFDVGKGINKIDVTREEIFAAQHSTTTQLVTASRPNVAGFATSSLPSVAGERPQAVSIFYYDNKVFIGTKRTAGHEFHIFDVTNPLSPVWLGSREVNHNINDIEVRGRYAYLATSGNIRDIIILDIFDPAHISQALAVDLPGNEDGKTINGVGDTIFLGRYKATAPGHNELNVLEIKTDGNGVLIDVVSNASAALGNDANDIVFAAGFVYVATSNTQKELQIFEWNALVKTLVLKKSINVPAMATSVDVEDGLVGLAVGNELYVYEQ